MSDGFKILRYDESEWLNKDGSNWTFWKTRIVPYLKGSRLWPYISGVMQRPADTEVDKLAKWEEMDAQALSMILMNIVPNVQAGLDCSSAKATWDGLTSRYAQVDPIAQNLAQTRLHMKHYVEGGTETLPAHISELQKLREACTGLGMPISDAQFTGVITLSMPTPSWDPIVGTLGGVLDPKVVISCLNTEWSRRQGLTSTRKAQTWCSRQEHGPNARTATGQGTSRRNAGKKEAVKRGNTPRDITHKPSTPSQTLQ